MTTTRTQTVRPDVGVAEPLVVALALDEEAQGLFDELRSRHFPAERLHVGAHLTLFHALPGEHLDEVRRTCERQAERAPFRIRVTSPCSLGRGAAFTVESNPLSYLRATLASIWAPYLTVQDRQPFRPHITVQNKVDPPTAERTLEELRYGFRPTTHRATGIDLWRYVGGPWEPVETFAFEGA